MEEHQYLQVNLSSTMLFCDVYEALDPGCCLLAVAKETGADCSVMFLTILAPRMCRLGIMNVHPDHFGKGLARQLLDRIVHVCLNEHNKPTRLVSSAMNLDSFSLYTRGGFVPRQIFQDMTLAVPEEGLPERAIPGLASECGKHVWMTYRILSQLGTRTLFY